MPTAKCAASGPSSSTSVLPRPSTVSTLTCGGDRKRALVLRAPNVTLNCRGLFFAKKSPHRSMQDREDFASPLHK
eukprot:5824549-Pyramimonas_sp.AAC.1